MKTIVTQDHVFHSLEGDDDVQPEEWANPRFGHRLEWSVYCKWCT